MWHFCKIYTPTQKNEIGNFNIKMETVANSWNGVLKNFIDIDVATKMCLIWLNLKDHRSIDFTKQEKTEFQLKKDCHLCFILNPHVCILKQMSAGTEDVWRSAQASLWWAWPIRPPLAPSANKPLSNYC